MADWWQREPFHGTDQPGSEANSPASVPATGTASAWKRLREAEWRHLLPIGVLVILVLAVRGAELWRQQRIVGERSRKALREVIAQEVELRKTGNVDAYLLLLDPGADPAWRQRQAETLTKLPLPVVGTELPIIEHWEFNGDAALVELWFSGPPASRETRFYRLVNGEWRRTSPVSTFWGDRSEADAPGVHFVFRQADGVAVREVVDALTAAYRQGNRRALAGQRLTVEIVPYGPIVYDGRENLLTLPSLREVPLPVGVPAGGPLLWLLSHPVIDRLLDPGNAARYHYLDGIQLLQDHLRYWSVRQIVPLPKHWQTQMEDALRAAWEEGLLVSPRVVNLLSANRRQAHLAYYAAMTMADYIAEQYGSESLLRLERVLTQTASWEQAFQIALGVQVGEFEQGWRDYLATRLRQPAPPESTPPVGGHH